MPKQVVFLVAVTLPLTSDLWSQLCHSRKRDDPELQAEMSPSSPLTSPPSSDHLLYSHFPFPLSVFYSYLLFQVPLFTRTLPFLCFTQMGSSSNSCWPFLVLASSALGQHSSLHSLFSRNILKTFLFSLLLQVYPLKKRNSFAAILTVSQVRKKINAVLNPPS